MNSELPENKRPVTWLLSNVCGWLRLTLKNLDQITKVEAVQVKMALEFSSSMKAPPVDEDANMQVTKVKGQSPGLDTEQDKSKADVEEELSHSTQDPSPFSTNRQKSFLQVPPKTYGEIHIHSVLQCSCEVMTCQFSEDGTLLAVGLNDGSIKVYSTDEGELLHTLSDKDSVLCSLPVTSLSFTHTNETHSVLLATYASGSLKCWYIWGRQCVWWVTETENGKNEGEQKRQSLCLSISPSGENAVTGGSDSDIYLYDLNTHQRIQILKSSSTRITMDGHSSRVFALKFHPERETEFISGGWDNSVQFWDTRQHNAVRMLYGPHVCGDALQIDPSTNQILSGSWRKDSTLEMYTCKWMGGDIVAAGGHANALRVLDRHSLSVKARLFDLPYAVYSSSICPSGKWAGLIAATCGDQVFLLSMDHRKKNTAEKIS
ncbi:uncharacterized protein LOC113650621 isoform X2 [Tachysurus fulvidraco]|uniref:uncharacterized protein LOC113650621 isoform X2 n=1 Tax=Tachysurus fulvidraco TaxID=1234273 RepID=UPI001FEF36DA|nr:uncharacterized protein LOC113650621 isoform X2 [Tachysurus fulvidraco]